MSLRILWADNKPCRRTNGFLHFLANC